MVGLPISPAMVTGRVAAAPGLVKDVEAWKGDDTGPLRHRPRARVTEVFDAATQRRVEARVSEVVVPELLPG